MTPWKSALWQAAGRLETGEQGNVPSNTPPLLSFFLGFFQGFAPGYLHLAISMVMSSCCS